MSKFWNKSGLTFTDEGVRHMSDAALAKSQASISKLKAEWGYIKESLEFRFYDGKEAEIHKACVAKANAQIGSLEVRLFRVEGEIERRKPQPHLISYEESQQRMRDFRPQDYAVRGRSRLDFLWRGAQGLEMLLQYLKPEFAINALNMNTGSVTVLPTSNKNGPDSVTLFPGNFFRAKYFADRTS